MDELLLARTADLGAFFREWRETNAPRAAAPLAHRPLGCLPRGGRAEAKLGATPVGHAPPAAGGPRRRDWTKRSAPVGCRAPPRQQLHARAANRRIEMQIRHYKRGGATRSGRSDRVRAVAGRAAALLGAPALSALAALQAVRLWLRPSRRAGTVRAGRMRTSGRRGGTARCRPGLRAGVRGAARRWGSVAHFPQARKPLVEKKRRARINESLQELRLLLAGPEVRQAGGCPGAAERVGVVAVLPGLTVHPYPAPPPAQVQAKLENAEVLELTVRRVQGALRGRARGEWRAGERAGRGTRLPTPPLPES